MPVDSSIYGKGNSCPVSDNRLAGKVALVAGGTRAAGRAISIALAEAGSTVYVTGRSSRNSGLSGDRPETIEETVDLIAERGGTGIAVRVDHNDEVKVRELISRIEHEQGRLDILVNDLWGGDPFTEWDRPYWEQNIEQGIGMFRNAVMTHVITAAYATPLMLRHPGSLIVEMTDGIGYSYRGNLFYSLVKISTNHLAAAYSVDLKEQKQQNIVSVALTPGFIRSEAVLDSLGVKEENWRDGARKDPHFAASETPFYVARCLVALAADPEVKRYDGECLSSWDLSKVYGIKDVDGRQPDWGKFFSEWHAGKRDIDKWMK